jgi:hypothetical protein
MRSPAMICKYANTCAFIAYGSHVAPFTAKMTKLKYCEQVQEGCARYNAYLVMDADLVPDDLWPNLEIKTLEMLERRFNESHGPRPLTSGETD